MTSLPADICSHIVQFMSKRDLCDMLSVNRTFFDLAMNARYHDALFKVFDDTALKRMRRLRDPAIAHRVRRVFVHRSSNKMCKFRDPDLEKLENDHIRTFNASFEEVTQSITDTLTCLTNVSYFSVIWTDVTAEEYLIPFITAAWRAFGSSLEVLALAVPLKYLPALLSTANNVTALRSLVVTLQNKVTETQDEVTILTTILAPFINNVAPTLRSLFLSCSGGLDLSPLYCGLGQFPSLSQFKFSTGFEMHELLEPLGLTRFLRHHAVTLRHITWRRDLDSTDIGQGARRMVEWLDQNKSDEVILSNLISLWMPVPVPMIPGIWDLITRCIKRSAETLTSLKVLGCYLDYDKVDALMSVFVPRPKVSLQKLHFDIRYLSPEILALLARTLPGLEELDIRILGVATCVIQPEASTTQETELLDMEIFASSLRKYDFRDWQLRNISIWPIPHTEMDINLMRMVAECVPSVQSFNGSDKNLAYFAGL